MNYFELFDLPPSLMPDQQVVKKKFYELSRKYHPDFYTKESDDEQNTALEKSSDLNKAYKIFTNQDALIKYVLLQKGILEEEEKYQLPPDFLMEVMEVNEQLQDAKAGGDVTKVADLKRAISDLQHDIFMPVEQILQSYNEQSAIEDLQPVKEYYFKKKYLDRILATF